MSVTEQSSLLCVKLHMNILIVYISDLDFVLS